jgi:hypothetical protein
MQQVIFAFDRLSLTPLSSAVSLGATSLSVSAASSLFLPTDQLFLGNADGSQAEWLGRVSASDADSLSFTRPVRREREPGSVLWKPRHWIRIEAGVTLGARRVIDPGVAVERSRGDLYYAVRLAHPVVRTTLEITDLPPSIESFMFDWINTVTSWGVFPFAVVDPFGFVYTVRFTGDPVERTFAKGDRLRVSYPIYIESEGAYR